MIKTRIALGALLLLLVITLTPVLTIASVKATTYINVNWGHLKHTSPDTEEGEYEEVACQVIYNRFYYAGGWLTYNVYGGDDATQTDLTNTISWRQQNDAWATDFWVGDFYPWPTDGSSTLHYYLYGGHTNGNWDDVKDDTLFDYTYYLYNKQYFPFIWACSCGSILSDPETCYGYIDQENWTGVVGMPYAWLGRNDLELYGYDSPDSSGYCYIGFDGPSKPLKEMIGQTGYSYSWFPCLVYEHALGYYGGGYHTLKQSLDFAANYIWGVDYGDPDCPLYYGYWNYDWNRTCWMRVFGDPNICLGD